jgi:hypothetical protein
MSLGRRIDLLAYANLRGTLRRSGRFRGDGWIFDALCDHKGGHATGIAAGISVRMGGCIVQWHAHVALMLARISSPLVLAWARGDSALREGVGARFVVVTRHSWAESGIPEKCLLQNTGGGGTESQTLFDLGSAPFDDEDPSLSFASLPSLATPPSSPLSPKQA